LTEKKKKKFFFVKDNIYADNYEQVREYMYRTLKTTRISSTIFGKYIRHHFVTHLYTPKTNNTLLSVVINAFNIRNIAYLKKNFLEQDIIIHTFHAAKAKYITCLIPSLQHLNNFFTYLYEI